jgi:hypothetical protein
MPKYLSPSNYTILEKTAVVKLLKKFSLFHGTRRFIAVFTSVPTGAYPKPNKSNPHTQLISLRSILILSSISTVVNVLQIFKYCSRNIEQADSSGDASVCIRKVSG